MSLSQFIFYYLCSIATLRDEYKLCSDVEVTCDSVLARVHSDGRVRSSFREVGPTHNSQFCTVTALSRTVFSKVGAVVLLAAVKIFPKDAENVTHKNILH
jgi:hypothetical protein